MSNYKSYFYKSLGLREENLPGGKGDGTDQNQVDQEQLQMGIKVEMEHTHDADLAKEIAMDHLSEDPQYYSHLKNAGMADELPNGQQPSQTPMMSKLISPTAIMPTPVIAVGIRGTKTGLLPAGGRVDDPEKARLGGLEQVKVLPQGGACADPEKARLGGLELVTNPKANSQGAFAKTPASDAIKADGGHYTPDCKDISGGKAPETSRKGDDNIHPMQVQQMGNKPFENDGTGRDDSGLKPGSTNQEPKEHPATALTKTGNDDLDKAGIDEPEEEDEESKKGPWGIELDDEDEDEEEGENVSVDIKETLREAKQKICFHCKKPKPCACDKSDDENQEASDPTSPKFDKNRFGTKNECATCGCGDPTDDHGMKDRFQKLANIKTEGWAMGEYTPEQQKALALLTRKGFREVSTFPAEPDAEGGNMGEQVVIVVQKKSGPVRLSGEIEPSGLVNGQPVEQFLATQVRESGLTSEDSVTQLKELVGRLNAKGKVTPLLQKAQAYLVKHSK